MGGFSIGDYGAAEGYARETIALCQHMGDRGTLGHSMILIGLCHVLSGRLKEAQEPLAEGVEIAKDLVNPLSQAYGLAVMSVRASLAGNYELGRRLVGESQEHHTNLFGVFLGHWAQAIALVGMGETEQAWQQSISTLEYSLTPGRDPDPRTTWMLPVVGIILSRQGQPERAVEILSLYFNHPKRPIGFVEGWPLLSEWQARLQENLGAEGYKAAWEQGRIMDLSTTVEALLAE